MKKINRYYVYNFCADSHFILIDTKTKNAQIYHANLYGQIYNINENKKEKLIYKINALKRKLNNRTDPIKNFYAIDKILFKHFLTSQEKTTHKHFFNEKQLNKDLITKGDDLTAVLKNMCKKVYELKNRKDSEKFSGHNKRYFLEYIKNINVEVKDECKTT